MIVKIGTCTRSLSLRNKCIVVFDGDIAVNNVCKCTRMCFKLLTCDSDLAIVYRSDHLPFLSCNMAAVH